MPIVLGYTPTAEGEAALERAVVEARAHELDVIAVDVSASSDPRILLDAPCPVPAVKVPR